MGELSQVKLGEGGMRGVHLSPANHVDSDYRHV